MLTIKIHEFAKYEMDEAIDWYNGQLIELGSQFKQVVLKQIQGIAENPSWFLQESEGIYKAYILKFPYKVLFSFDETKVVIWAISHLHRKPNHWQNRRGKSNTKP